MKPKNQMTCQCCGKDTYKAYKGKNKYCPECSVFVFKIRKQMYAKIHALKQKIKELKEKIGDDL